MRSFPSMFEMKPVHFHLPISPSLQAPSSSSTLEAHNRELPFVMVCVTITGI